jgi:3-hydroxybutyryl-CoA dehydratase
MGDGVAFSPGQSVSLSRAISGEDVDAFARATGDTNPIRLDEVYASKTRFKRRIAHGMLPVHLGDRIEAVATVLKYREDKAIMSLDTAAYNQRGEKVLGGEAVCLVIDVLGAQQRYKRSNAAVAG